MAAITLKPINKKRMSFAIRGVSPLIQHKWAEKALTEMRDKQQGKKTRERTKRDPAAEAQDATYVTADGRIGIPGMAFKSALVAAAHKDIGIEKTLVRKALFLVTDDPDKVLPIEADTPTIREDTVRVGMGSADLRYRPEFLNWRCEITLIVDGDLMQEKDVLSLVDRAGFGVGICEWRPEKGGEYGRFEVDASHPVTWG